MKHNPRKTCVTLAYAAKLFLRRKRRNQSVNAEQNCLTQADGAQQTNERPSLLRPLASDVTNQNQRGLARAHQLGVGSFLPLGCHRNEEKRPMSCEEGWPVSDDFQSSTVVNKRHGKVQISDHHISGDSSPTLATDSRPCAFFFGCTKIFFGGYKSLFRGFKMLFSGNKKCS